MIRIRRRKLYPSDIVAAMTKILVIDDEAAIRKVVCVLLRQVGYDVTDAEHGLSGIAMARSEKPDLILLDLMMPVVDGFEVLKRLREDPVAKRIPVIMLTAKIDAASERACMDLGAVDYIKKPWGPLEIEERVAMALGYPELVKRQEVATVQPTAEIENVTSHGDGHMLGEPQDISPARFKTKEFRVRRGEVDNPYLA